MKFLTPVLLRPLARRRGSGAIDDLRVARLHDDPGKAGRVPQGHAEIGRPTRGAKYGTLEGSWTTEFGTLNQFVTLWSYADLVERERLRTELQDNEVWKRDYVPRIFPILLAMENKILSAQLPLKSPDDGDHIYELRTYRTQVGKTGEWLGHFKAIMPVREKYSKNVGLWQTEVAQLNEVVHLWAYRDLNDRAAVRAKVAQDPEWQAFLAKATPLLVEMRSTGLTAGWSGPARRPARQPDR